MRNTILLCLAVLAFHTLFAQFPAGFTAVSVLQNLDPTAMTLAPNGDIFLTEKSGTVRIIRNGAVLPQPFIELEVDNFNERGLGGIAVHPDYPNTPYVYLYYTVPGANRNRIVRVQAANDQAIPGTLETLLTLDILSATVHNGGAMLFGLDGMLYVTVGDGSAFQVAQSLQSFLGKILRLNPDGTIPADNPFYGQTTNNYRAIWALGFRNPFTFTQQPVTGRLAVGDVGSNQYEEIDIVEAGKNYGWPTAEGNWTSGNPPPANYQDPLYAYDHGMGCSITGAAFYNPITPQFPAEYTGKLFFGDYCRGRLWTIDPVNGGNPVQFATGLNRPLALLTHPDGSLYCITRGGQGGGSQTDNTSSNGGVLWRINYNPSGAPLVATQPNDVTVVEGETARFEVTAAGDPPFSYQWFRDGLELSGATANSLLLPNVMLADSGALLACRVSNNNGSVSSNPAVLRVTANQRPVASIEVPAAGSTYAAGEMLAYSGTGTDPETGTLTPQNLTWRIDFHHDEHTHPFLPPTTGTTGGTIQIPQIGETAHNVWYRVHLFATDAAGLTNHVFRDIFPRKAVLNFQTQPAGLPLLLDGQPIATPSIDTSVVGVIRTITAPTFAESNGQGYFFENWSDGEDFDEYAFETPAQNLNLTANYQPLQLGTGTGLLGLYFNNDDGSFSQPVTAWRIDAGLDFYWPGSPFAPSIGDDNFAVRWLGDIEPWLTGEYVFYLTGDDGVRLEIAGNSLIDSWMPSDGETRVSGPISLEAGTRYPIRVELYEIGGESEIKLEWGLRNGGKIKVPATQLYPSPFTGTQDGTALGGLRYRVLPNPFSQAGNLELWAPVRTPVSVEVYDLAGRILYRQTGDAPVGYSNQPLGLEQAAAGMYLVKITAATQSVVLKVIKL
ncbi:MAG: hypothetical protein DA408_16500 [Bacteroidetes bacterium]|nr:MAG: hypothetical protein DA408_16500 [Bacteroidota bacterium]